jgi:hypothetical protein
VNWYWGKSVTTPGSTGMNPELPPPSEHAAPSKVDAISTARNPPLRHVIPVMTHLPVSANLARLAPVHIHILLGLKTPFSGYLRPRFFQFVKRAAISAARAIAAPIVTIQGSQLW